MRTVFGQESTIYSVAQVARVVPLQSLFPRWWSATAFSLKRMVAWCWSILASGSNSFKDRLIHRAIQIFVYGYQSSKSLWVSARDWISELGFKASDVTPIIPTHLDFDHCGDLVDFPGARVHVRTVEHERYHQPVTAMDKLRYLSRHFDHGPLWQLYDDPGGDAWYGFDTVEPLVGLDDDLLLVALPGHSVGHVGVAVRAESGWILHAGDAYQRKHLFDPPTLGSRIIRRQIDEDAQIAEDTQKRLASVIGVILSSPSFAVMILLNVVVTALKLVADSAKLIGVKTRGLCPIFGRQSEPFKMRRMTTTIDEF